MAKQDDVRLLALETLLEVEKNKVFVKDALNRLLFQKQFMSKQERAFLTRIVEGVTEYQVRLDYVINCFSKTKVNKCKPLIRCVLRMGVYQILYMDAVPNEIACDESVKLAKKKGFHNLTGFVNGVLRNIVRNVDQIVYPNREDNLVYFLSVYYSMPLWLVECLLAWYGEEVAESVLKASLKATDLTIRVNTCKTTKEALKEKLEEANVTVNDGFYVEEALHLEHINYVKRLPGFMKGEFFVQDESSMLLYHVADLKVQAGECLQILDLCAAPGGKSTHFAQMLKEGARIEARDLTEQKVALIDENVKRLALTNMQTKVWDALIDDPEKHAWADVVIADLPCSGLGIIAKKNDVKYQVSKQQLEELVKLQRQILEVAQTYVKPGGLLLYSTCTINPAENIDNALWFLEQFDFEAEAISEDVSEKLDFCMPKENMLQLLPGINPCDGFFIAKFRKNK